MGKPILTFLPAGPAISAGLHLAALAGLVLFVRPVPLPEAEERVIEVELVAPPPAVAVAEPAPMLAAPEAGLPDDPVPPAAADGMIEATHMLAGAALADPRNAEARAMLKMIVPSLRREQVCGIEAMEQIKLGTPDWSPECVISYAYADVEIAGNAVTASGAVVLNGTDWYRLAYECTLGADLASVTAFRYRLGDVVSEAETQRLELAPCK